MKTAGAPYALKATTDRQSLDGSRKELAHVVVDVVDKAGNTVYNAENEITISVEGPAILLGLESGSLVSHENYKASKRKALHGKLLGYLQAQQKAGKVKVIFQSPGLQSHTVEVQVSNDGGNLVY